METLVYENDLCKERNMIGVVGGEREPIYAIHPFDVWPMSTGTGGTLATASVAEAGAAV